MKLWRTLIPLLTLSLVALPVLAQDSGGLITLDDNTPSIDVNISMPADTTGVVALDVTETAISLVNDAGDVMLQTMDARVHGLELNVAPNSGAHTLTVKRLPGVVQAAVQVRSLPDLTNIGATQTLDATQLTLNQARVLVADVAQSSTHVSIPQGQPGVIDVSYPGVVGNLQITDALGVILLSASSDVDGINLVLDPGEYDVTLQTQAAPPNTQVSVQVNQANSFTVLAIPTATTVPPTPQPQTSNAQCEATLTPLRTNFYSGPGTGYSLVGYGNQGQNYFVGGINRESNWLVVGTNIGGVWVSTDNVSLSGNCSNLTVFDTPLLDAQSAPRFNGDD